MSEGKWRKIHLVNKEREKEEKEKHSSQPAWDEMSNTKTAIMKSSRPEGWFWFLLKADTFTRWFTCFSLFDVQNTGPSTAARTHAYVHRLVCFCTAVSSCTSPYKVGQSAHEHKRIHTVWSQIRDQTKRSSFKLWAHVHTSELCALPPRLCYLIHQWPHLLPAVHQTKGLGVMAPWRSLTANDEKLI